MKKTVYAITVIAVVAIAIVAVALLYQPLTQPRDQYHFYGFETGFSGWETGADVPDDPNNPGHPVNWTITLNGNRSHAGNQSLRLFLDGSQDDGTIWTQRKISLTPSSSSNVSVSFQLWSESESFNTLANVVGYFGTKAPAAEGDFQVLGAANQAEGWRAYSFNAVVQAGGSGDAYVAVGISAVWETQMTYYMDDVEVTIK